MATVVIGVGYVGRRLLDARDDAIGLSRTAGERVEVTDLDGDSELPVSTGSDDALVYTVPPARDHDADPRLARLLDRLAPPGRFVYLGTTGVYGDCAGAIVDETAPLNPQNARSRRRVAAETLLTSWCTQHSVPLVILRIPGIYGPGRLGVDRLRAAAPVLAEADANPGNRIHVDDLVRAIVAALSATPGIYNVGDGDHRSSTWFAGEVARQLGIAPPPEVGRAEAERSFSEMRLSFLAESRRVDTAKMQEQMGPVIHYGDASDGIAAALREEKLA